LPVNDHSFQPVPNSSQTVQAIPQALPCCARSNNSIFVKRWLLLLPPILFIARYISRFDQKQIEDPTHYFESSVATVKSPSTKITVLTTTALTPSPSCLLQHQASPPLSTLHAASSRLLVNLNTLAPRIFLKPS
jgi:hypothetical protein